MAPSDEITSIPETLAVKADRRALEIFEREARYERTFQQCLGQVYLIGLKVGLEIANQCNARPDGDSQSAWGRSA
jgi:hypothetical protein